MPRNRAKLNNCNTPSNTWSWVLFKMPDTCRAMAATKWLMSTQPIHQQSVCKTLYIPTRIRNRIYSEVQRSMTKEHGSPLLGSGQSSRSEESLRLLAIRLRTIRLALQYEAAR